MAQPRCPQCGAKDMEIIFNYHAIYSINHLVIDVETNAVDVTGDPDSLRNEANIQVACNVCNIIVPFDAITVRWSENEL